jgi:pimeloyl-ACP methyl ester carboxylesterase
MVIAPNAYWLNFFLKRDINVICWNYRGYGASTIGSFDYSSPIKAKLDAERVLAKSYDILKLQGKIGVYGRSIGGIPACHLASKYKNIVVALMIDRSLNELKDWI